MIAYYTKRSPGEEFEKLSKPLKQNVWVDGQNLEVDELRQLVSEYELNPNIVYDVRDNQELPRLEFSGNVGYAFLRVPRLANSGHIASSPLLCVVKPTAFLTLSMNESFSPETIMSTTLPTTTKKTNELLLGVVAACVSSYQDLLLHTDRGITDTGNRLKTHEITNHDFIHFVTVEDNLNSFRMNLEGMLSVTSRIQDAVHFEITDDHREALDDIALQIQQLLVAVESYTGRVESIRNAYSTIANTSLNQRMKTLTVFTVLITLPNVFYGMYGMNVAIPFMHEPWAFGAVVGFTALLIITVYVVAKKLKIF